MRKKIVLLMLVLILSTMSVQTVFAGFNHTHTILNPGYNHVHTTYTPGYNHEHSNTTPGYNHEHTTPGYYHTHYASCSGYPQCDSTREYYSHTCSGTSCCCEYSCNCNSGSDHWHNGTSTDHWHDAVTTYSDHWHDGYYTDSDHWHDAYYSDITHYHDPYAAQTYPTGTLVSPTLVSVARPTITWNQSDYSNGNVTMTKYQVRVYNESGVLVKDSGEVTQNQAVSQSWSGLTSDLALGAKYQVETRVYDGVGWSAYSARTWMMRNRVPVVNITSPTGTSVNPTRNNAQALNVTWTYSDPDNHPQTQYRVRIYNSATSTLYRDSGIVTSASNSWSTVVAFPYNTGYYVRVEVSDSYEWTTSTSKYFKINAQSIPTLTKPSGTSAAAFSREPRAFNATWTYSDPENDPQASYRLRIINNATSGVFSDSGVINSAALLRNITGLSRNTLYRAELTTYDGYDWGVMNTKYFFTNLVPSSSITFPTGTTMGTATGSPVPFSITWDHIDPDGDAQTQYELQVYRASNNVLAINSGVITSSSNTFNVTSAHGLIIGETYYIRVRTYDGESWSSWSPNRYFITNRPPEAKFDWSPKPVWEGDTITLINQSRDADNDALTYVWTIVRPNGTSYTSTAINPTITPVVPGTYSVSLRATDIYGADHSIASSISVLNLTVGGAVSHTSEWENIRLQYNDSNPTTPRLASVFWRGENLVISGTTTDTGSSATQATLVVATLLATGESVTLTSTNRQNWTGLLTYSDSLVPDGPSTVRIRATWSNGLVEDTNVIISFNGHMMDAIGYQNR